MAQCAITIPRYAPKWDSRWADVLTLYEAINHTDWTVLLKQYDVNVAIETIYKCLYEVVISYVPVKKMYIFTHKNIHHRLQRILNFNITT